MASTPVISSPADFSIQSVPFDITGTSDGAIVEVRDSAGLLLPATANPVAVVGGNYSIHVTSLTGNKGGVYVNGTGTISIPPNIGVEAGFPLIGSGAGAITIATAGVTTAGPSLVVAIVLAGKGASGEYPLTSVAGGGLTWSRVAGASGNYASGSQGSEIWTAVSAGALSNQTITATATGAAGHYLYGVMAIYSVTGAFSTPVGNSANVQTPAGAAQVSITASASGNMLLCGIWNPSNSTIPVALAFNSPWGQSGNDAGNGYSYAVGHGFSTGAGAQIVGSSSTFAGDCSVTAVEIRAS